jgi:hypothetical protein
LPSQVACIIEACGRVMVARSEGFQNWELAPLATLVFAPASPAELAPISKPRKSPALVPTATSANAGRTAKYKGEAARRRASSAEIRFCVRNVCANRLFRIG